MTKLASKTQKTATSSAGDDPVRRLCAVEGVESPAVAMGRRADRLLDRVQAFGGLGQLPVDIDLLASFAGITSITDVPGLPVVAQIRPGANGEGGLIVERRAEDSLARRRFSTGHEIGHTLFPDFWASPMACRPPSDDALVGAAADPVETLCEVAGAQLLLPTRLVAPYLSKRPLDMSTVVELAEMAEASLVAAGRRVVDLAGSPGAFVIFSGRLSKTQLRSAEEMRRQPVLPGFFKHDVPQAKFRIDYSHCSPGMAYLPREKSFDAETFLRAKESGGIERAREEVQLHGKSLALDVTVLCAPMTIAGQLRDRYLATVSLAQE